MAKKDEEKLSVAAAAAKELEASGNKSPHLERAIARLITVEPVIMLVAVAIGIFVVIQPQYLQQRVAAAKNVTLPQDRAADGNGSSSTCSAQQNRSDPYYIALQEVQADVAYWQMIFTIAAFLPSLIMSPFLGAWGDTVGRKVILGLAVLGYFIVFVAYVLTLYLVLPLWVIPIAYFLQGLTGGTGLIIAGSVSYVTDVTTAEKRLLRIGVVHGSFLIGIGLTQLAVGYLVESYGFGPPLWIAGCTISACLFYIIVPPLLIETIDTKQKSKSDSADVNSIQSLINLFKIKAAARRWRLGLLFTIEFMNETLNASAVGVIIIYGLGPPFCWDSVLVAGYWTMLLFSSALAMIFVTKLLSLCLSDFWVLQVSMVFAIFNGLVTAFARGTIGLYIAALIGCLRAISQPLIPLILSKMVTTEEHGVVFAFEASILNLGSLISPLLLNNVYSATVQTQPNAVFILLGAASFIPLFLTGVLQIVTKRTQYSVTTGVDNETGEGKSSGIVNQGVDIGSEEKSANGMNGTTAL